jgi:hypothetical protein
MATKKKRIKAIIQLRRATEREWIDYNPILRVGEPALSTDVYKLKIGDGLSEWRELPYLSETEIEAVMERIDNLTINDLIDGSLNIDCGTSTTVI